MANCARIGTDGRGSAGDVLVPHHHVIGEYFLQHNGTHRPPEGTRADGSNRTALQVDAPCMGYENHQGKKSIAPHGPPAQLDFASYVAPSPRLALGAATWTPRLGGLHENASCRHRSYGSTKARTDNALWVQVGTGSLQLPARQLGNRPSPRRSPTCKGHLPRFSYGVSTPSRPQVQPIAMTKR